MENYLIIDDNGIIWSSSSPDAEEQGAALIDAVANGNRELFEEHLGDTWQGDLVLVKELARTR